MMIFAAIVVALALALALALPAALLAAPYDAGQGLRDVQPPRLGVPAERAPDWQIEERAPLRLPDGRRIAIHAFKISGAGLYPEAELRALLADAEGREHSLAELQQLAERITRHYRDDGYLLARAYLPAQEIRDGVLEIAVLEGRLGQVELDNHSGLADAVLTAPLSSLERGAVLRQRTLERSLLLLSDTPGVEVQSTLRPGVSVGASDLKVEVAPGRRLTGNVNFDTYGNRYTGQYRSGAAIDFNNPFQLGDQFSVRAVVSDAAMSYVRGAYQLPLGPFGTRVGAAYSDMRYELGKEFAALNADGEAQIASLYALHPLLRSRSFNLYAQLGYDNKRLVDRAGRVQTVSNRQVDAWTASLSGDGRDDLAGGGVMSYSLAYTAGNLGLNSAPDLAMDGSSTRRAGGYDKWSLNLLRLQQLSDDTSLYLAYTRQFARKNLDSSEKLSLGGAYGVRAYPQGEATGDEGHLLTAELRRNLALPLPGLWQAAAFFDHGRITLNSRPWVAGGNHLSLSGAGLALHAMQPDDWLVKFTLAWRVGDEMPSSGPDAAPRVWAQAVKYF
ncbi:MAG: ShlB/FhaC/HecB family hemolysin secretion/activation protein [Methylococcaceae bacterium]|nr:MAG: ShlB/FhaC/HecB family hemolysin secretion/activation protein [Methylococcaceae bacterium]